MTPRVTVLLAVKDGEPWVRQAVESVLAQTFEDFELLVVDDGSTDSTAATVEAYGDPRIRVLRNERNLGQVPSLNRGLREARGEYVARLDHDDWCLPRRLERQVAVLDAEPEVGLVGSWLDAVDERGRKVAGLRERLDDYAELVFHTLIMRVYVTHPAAMFRRAPVLELGGYDEATGPSEDKDLWRRLALARWEARIVPEVLLAYRLHAAQLSQTRAAYQREIDGASQDRFLAELAPELDLRPARLLLAADERFWGEDAAAALAAVERLLEGARGRLRLGEAEAAKVERLLAAWLLRFAAAQPWRAEARAVARWALARAEPGARRRFAASAAAAPARIALRRGARTGLGAPVRRSRLARRLYARLVGGG